MINCMSGIEQDKFFDELCSIDVECEEDLESIDNIFEKYNIKFESDIDCVFDSPGCDVYSYAYSFIINDEPNLFMGSYSNY